MIKVLRMGYNAIHDKDFVVSRPNGYDWYLLLYIKSAAIFIIQGEEIVTPANTMIIYDRNVPHDYRAYGAEYKNDWIHFEIEREVLEQLGIPVNQLFDVSNHYYITDLMQKAATEFFSHNLCKEQTLHHLLMLILNKASEQLLTTTVPYLHTRIYDDLVKLRSEIYSNPHNPWNITEMAARLHISNGYFHNIYKEIFSTTCISDVIQSRMIYAKEMLAETDNSILEISSLCGYQNEVHFMRQFKKINLITPLEFRKANKPRN